MAKMMKMMSMKMGMKKMAMKKSVIARGRVPNRQAMVLRGTKLKTSGGLTKSDLKKNPRGRVVSIKKSNAARKKGTFQKISTWGKAVKQAYREMGLKGFVPVGGKKSALSQALYQRVKQITSAK